MKESLLAVLPFAYLLFVYLLGCFMAGATKPMATRKPYKFKKIMRVLFEKNPEI